MSKKNVFFSFLLWIVIIVSFIVLVFTVNRQLKRNQALKRLDSLAILEDIEKEDKDSLIYENSTSYPIESNSQKKWLDINPDYQGWIKIENTNIDYPLVRASDNYFYLNRDFLKEDSELGAIFMDYRNIGNFNDRHTAIYGHYTWTGKMFGDLHNYKEELFSRENKIIKIKTLYGDKEFEVFSVYLDSADGYELKINFKDDAEYKDYLQSLSDLSIHSFDFKPNTEKLLITLATCSYEVGDGRLILHAIEK